MQYLRLSALLLSLLSSTILLSVPAWADEPARADGPESPASSKPAAAAEDVASEPGKGSPGENGSGTVLHGGVRGSAVRLEEGLGLIDSSSRMVQSSAFELAKECTRKETAVMRGPNYIGNGIVIPALGGNGTGMVQAGELPARKDKAEAFLSTAEAGMKALRTHVDGLIIPEGASEDMTNLWHGMQSSMQAGENNITAMREIVNQLPAKKGEIKQKDAKPLGRAALKVYDSMTALRKMKDQLDDMVKTKLKG
jgi:hypothetical protein